MQVPTLLSERYTVGKQYTSGAEASWWMIVADHSTVSLGKGSAMIFSLWRVKQLLH